jgi:hypothetical protein
VPQRILVVPAACYLAISLSCLVLFFPQTLHSVVLNSTIKACFEPSLAQLELQDDVLSARSEDHERWSQLAAQAYALRDAQMSGVEALEGKMKMLELEVSRGRFGPADLAKIYEKSKELSVRAYGLSCMIVSHSGWFYRNGADFRVDGHRRGISVHETGHRRAKIWPRPPGRAAHEASSWIPSAEHFVG